MNQYEFELILKTKGQFFKKHFTMDDVLTNKYSIWSDCVFQQENGTAVDQEWEINKSRLYSGIKTICGQKIYDGDILSARKNYKYLVKFENGSFVGYHLDSGLKWGELSRIMDPDMTDIYQAIRIIGNTVEGIVV